jgi:hypothetical protein
MKDDDQYSFGLHLDPHTRDVVINIAWAVAGVVAFGLIVTAGRSCQQSSDEVLRECVKHGHTIYECHNQQSPTE